MPTWRTAFGHGPVGALVSAWPALVLAGSYELLMLLIQSGHQVDADYLRHTLRDGLTVIKQKAGPLETA